MFGKGLTEIEYEFPSVVAYGEMVGISPFQPFGFAGKYMASAHFPSVSQDNNYRRNLLVQHDVQLIFVIKVLYG